MADHPENVRRKDRQQSEPQFLKNLLTHSVSCSIAVEKEGFPLLHVAFFVYDEANDEIIFHFSRHGYAGEEITEGKKACVSIYKYGKLYTAGKAVDFGCEYQSAIIYGTIRIITDEAARMKAMQVFFDKFFAHIPKDSYTSFTEQQAKPIHIAKIRIDKWFGKEHHVPEHAVSSFYYPESPVM